MVIAEMHRRKGRRRVTNSLHPYSRATIIGRIVILAHAGRMALRAHKVPILFQLCPVEDIVVLDVFVRVEVEPMLATLFFR